MPYRTRRRKTPAYRRKALYRRRRAAHRRTYGRRAAPTVKRTLFRPRRSAGPSRHLASIPMTIRNNVPRRRIIPITFTDSVVLYPEDDTLGQFGAASYCWRASSPNFVNSATTSNLGAVHHLDPSNITGVNAMCEPAFDRYEQFKVLKSQIQMVLSPTVHASGETWAFVQSSNCYLTLSDSIAPWNVGSTVASLDPESSIRNGRNVKAARLIRSAQGGSANRPVMIDGTYTPRRVFDKHIDPSKLIGQTAGDYLVAPTHPNHQAYWNLVIMPGEPFPASAGGASFYRGVPYPTRVDLKITYLVEFFGVEVNTSAYQAYDNAPIA